MAENDADHESVLLAPDIQETLLIRPRLLTGEDPVPERDLRAVVAEVD